MTSMEFFRHLETKPSAPIDWGTTEPRHIPLDSSLNRAPTFLQKNQPEKQFYRVSALQLSDIRDHDQVESRPLELNMNLLQNPNPFPMQHPFYSQISNKAVFPDYVAPEDTKRGEKLICSNNKSITVETKAAPEPMIVISKQAGFPYRHELRLEQMPSQKQGAWWIDNEQYQNPKPDRSQSFYPTPLKAFVPNQKLRNFSASLDTKNWNILRNKERDLMQTTHQIDFYKDGLGTRAPLNSDNLNEKAAKLDKAGIVDETMKPYFKRGDGLFTYSLANFEQALRDSASQQQQQKELAEQFNHEQEFQNGPYTRLEVDEYELQNGREYKNYPESQYKDVQKMSITQKTAPTPTLERSATIASMDNRPARTYEEFLRKKTENMSTGGKEERSQLFHNQVQAMETENRFKNLELITPDRDIRLLRINMNEIENARGAKPNFKQNVKEHVNTLYDQEYQYLGERSDLYKTSYNPYELNQHIVEVKDNQQSAHINGYLNKTESGIPNDTYEHRPKLFAHKVFMDFHDKKRAQQEQGLLNPSGLAHPILQEDGFILKQSEYGGNYNTKKFLQENEFDTQRLTDPIYQPIDKAELDYQNVALKSRVEDVALNDYKAGINPNPKDLYSAQDKVDAYDKQNKAARQSEYPRLSGPFDKPFETIYSADNIIEHGNGYTKRFDSRVYNSPFAQSGPSYEPLHSDLKTLAEIEQKKKEDGAKTAREETIDRAPVTIKDRSRATVSRRVTEVLKEKCPISIHEKDYSQFSYTSEESCPTNDFYKKVEYTTELFSYDKPHQSRLTTLQDKWTKSDAQRKFLSEYKLDTADQRENKNLYKKPHFISPVSCANANLKKEQLKTK